jgi:23S rRNA (cytosine1962-C5)-methyltransferase
MNAPPLPANCIAYEDADLVVVCKPVHVPSQSNREGGVDDLTSRLRAFMHARDGVAPYLGTHQRLDQPTSGLLLFTKRREVNAAIAAQFEGRTVDKRYLACVQSTRKVAGQLVHELRKGPDGNMLIAARGVKGTQRAETDVVEVRAVGPRRLLELTLRTGRTHQARVQLAAVGAPIVGCDLYGGLAHPRLLLHAHKLTIVHPTTGQPLVVTAEMPLEFTAFLDGKADPQGLDVYANRGIFAERFAAAVHRRFGVLAAPIGQPETTACRLINEEGDGFPRLAVDVYGDAAVVQLYGDDGPWAGSANRDQVYDALTALGYHEIYLKIRPVQANLLVDTRTESTAPRLPVRGTPAATARHVLEHGVGYPVDLGDGLSTGLFLDQRENRRLVASLCKGKRLLNLFAYACGFTIAAAAAGARETVSVDAAVNTLEKGRAAVLALGVNPARHQFFAEDVFDWLKLAQKRGDKFDVIVLDPPSYSKTKRHRFVTDEDYTGLAAAVLALLAPGGQLLACSNHRKTSMARFRRFLRAASTEAGVALRQLKDVPEPVDFPYPIGAECHLKALLAVRA